eukprot:1161127-Pelagomonas_calceolata.AAC.1
MQLQDALDLFSGEFCSMDDFPGLPEFPDVKPSGVPGSMLTSCCCSMLSSEVYLGRFCPVSSCVCTLMCTNTELEARCCYTRAIADLTADPLSALCTSY